jgi:hypothetical protein
MKEEWRFVVGDENYMVSNFGNVKSIPRLVTVGVRGGVMMTNEKILKPSVIKNTGYLQVQLSNRKKHSIHRLVLMAFVGPCPNGMEGAHLDGNRQNPELSNLRWATKKENAKDRVAHGTHPRGSKNPFSKFTEDQIPHIRADKRSRVEVAREHGVTPEAISSIVNRKNWGWL